MQSTGNKVDGIIAHNFPSEKKVVAVDGNCYQKNNTQQTYQTYEKNFNIEKSGVQQNVLLLLTFRNLRDT
ncbi:hypothetical protein [Klebsiella aerogenes]|uniref:hypothetical protein n=1 Tax=Klebsiella aerogenes TaxID=548 RepID=UPI00254E221B|nr:hypothetical protein [Klebsiella aerogenes]MDK7100068.1 hypothetical protein [Klebsiella aerogenes]MDK7850440.1 hypothetical protein [Klebsiella aerogenes]MDK8313051.1 hypothetical protein [Klebsiella aerogenes]